MYVLYHQDKAGMAGELYSIPPDKGALDGLLGSLFHNKYAIYPT